jgi:hypothetical protein
MRFDPIRSIGLGLGAHNNEQGHAFLLSLIRHAECPPSGTDLVVECGNARYQDVMDRFIAGDDIPHESLRRTWQNTTQPHAGCDVPIHEEDQGVKVFTVGQLAAGPATLRPSITVWPRPSLAFVRGTVLGAADFSSSMVHRCLGRP